MTTDAETETTATTTATTTEESEEEQETETASTAQEEREWQDTLTKEELLLRLAETRQYYRERYETLQRTDAEICTRLLSTRLDGLHLHRCYLSQSTIPHAGLGLFARRHIAAGELITLYPGDAVVLRTEADEQEDAKKKKAGETMLVDTTAQQRGDRPAVPVLPNNNVNNNNKKKTRCTPLVTKIVFGDHVRVEDRTLDQVMSYASRGYEMELDDTTSIIGNPARTPTSPWDPAYGAHYANDGAFLNDFAPAARAQYYNHTVARYNAANFVLESGAHVGMIATHTIAPEAEIFLSYGEGYWLSRLTDNHDDDDDDDDGTHPTATTDTTTKKKTATTPAEAERMLQDILTGMSQRRKENTQATTLSSSTVNNNNTNHKTDKDTDKDSPMSSRKKKQYKSKAKNTTKKKKKKGFGKE